MSDDGVVTAPRFLAVAAGLVVALCCTLAALPAAMTVVLALSVAGSVGIMARLWLVDRRTARDVAEILAVSRSRHPSQG